MHLSTYRIKLAELELMHKSSPTICCESDLAGLETRVRRALRSVPFKYFHLRNQLSV